MRQFGLRQAIPPPNPHSWDELKKLDKFVHAAHTSCDWAQKHAVYVSMWDRPQFIDESRPYDESTYLDYRRWYQREGLHTVFIRGQVQ